MQHTITQVLGAWGYWGVFALIFAENMFPPIPSEVILTFSGFLTTCTQLDVWGVILAATAGSVAGAVALYGAGRLLSAERLAALLDGEAGRRLHLTRADVERANAWFAARGTLCVLYGRCVPIIRSLVSIPAGMASMRLAPFLSLTTLGSLVWNIVLVHLGAWAGESWPVVSAWFARLSGGVRIVLLCAVALSAALLVVRHFKKKKIQ